MIAIYGFQYNSETGRKTDGMFLIQSPLVAHILALIITT